MALFHEGQWARAIEWSQRSLELYPDDLSTVINAACLSARAGRKDEALDATIRAFRSCWRT